jgi:hypothetical protein
MASAVYFGIQIQPGSAVLRRGDVQVGDLSAVFLADDVGAEWQTVASFIAHIGFPLGADAVRT